MEQLITNRLKALQFGEPQQYKNITILPLLAPDGIFQYRTLGEALRTSDITITEVSQGGSVPELMVINRGNSPVLLVDGEELAGAKQNRVLNTSILVKGSSEARIPVSCTEQGRWSYLSAAFVESGNVMSPKARGMKSSSVTGNLHESASYCSDQSQVWSEISELQAKARHRSPTSAMNDVFKAREGDLREAAGRFECRAGQVGLFVIRNGVACGFDVFSLSAACRVIHPKLVRSHILEALLDQDSPTAPGVEPLAVARAFMEQVQKAVDKRFESKGLGHDHRCESSEQVGSALVHEGEVIHSAFFRKECPGGPEAEEMASMMMRRRFRR
jgi:hypothetical protein